MSDQRSFSERIGARSPRALQLDSLDAETKVGIGNALEHFGGGVDYQHRNTGNENRRRGAIARYVLSSHFHYRMRDLPDFDGVAWARMLEVAEGAAWHEYLGALEVIGRFLTAPEQKTFFGLMNRALARYNVGYRFAGERLVPLTSDLELGAVEAAQTAAAKSAKGAEIHLRDAVAMLRAPNANYRNSIKESISAVEAAVKHLTGNSNATLGDALRRREQLGLPVHKALAAGWNSLYSWTSDEGGIRHALMDEPNLDLRDALYMLVTCSAFVSYLLSGA